MKFDYMFSNQPTNVDQHDIAFCGSNLIKYGKLQSCWNCGELTNWIDLNFEANLCSTECFNKKWKEFKEDFNKGVFNEN